MLERVEKGFGLKRRAPEWDLGGCLWHFGGCISPGKATGSYERQASPPQSPATPHQGHPSPLLASPLPCSRHGFCRVRLLWPICPASGTRCRSWREISH